MANTDYQTQLTLLYNKLVAIQSSLSKLAKLSEVNTVQSSLQYQLDNIASRLNTLTGTVESLQLTVNDLLVILRSQ